MAPDDAKKLANQPPYGDEYAGFGPNKPEQETPQKPEAETPLSPESVAQKIDSTQKAIKQEAEQFSQETEEKAEEIGNGFNDNKVKEEIEKEIAPVTKEADEISIKAKSKAEELREALGRRTPQSQRKYAEPTQAEQLAEEKARHKQWQEKQRAELQEAKLKKQAEKKAIEKASQVPETAVNEAVKRIEIEELPEVSSEELKEYDSAAESKKAKLLKMKEKAQAEKIKNEQAKKIAKQYEQTVKNYLQTLNTPAKSGAADYLMQAKDLHDQLKDLGYPGKTVTAGGEAVSFNLFDSNAALRQELDEIARAQKAAEQAQQEMIKIYEEKKGPADLEEIPMEDAQEVFGEQELTADELARQQEYQQQIESVERIDSEKKSKETIPVQSAAETQPQPEIKIKPEKTKLPDDLEPIDPAIESFNAEDLADPVYINQELEDIDPPEIENIENGQQTADEWGIEMINSLSANEELLTESRNSFAVLDLVKKKTEQEQAAYEAHQDNYQMAVIEKTKMLFELRRNEIDELLENNEITPEQAEEMIEKQKKEVIKATLLDEVVNLENEKTDLKIANQKNQTLRKVGEIAGQAVKKYRSLNWKTKVGLGIALLGAGAAGGAAGGALGAAVFVSAEGSRRAMRLLGSASAGLGVDQLLKGMQERKHKKEAELYADKLEMIISQQGAENNEYYSEEEAEYSNKLFDFAQRRQSFKKYRYGIAITTGTALALGLPGKAIGQLFGSGAEEAAAVNPSREIKETAVKSIPLNLGSEAAEQAGAGAAEQAKDNAMEKLISATENLKSGGTVWGMIKEQLANYPGFEDLSAAEKTYLIDYFKDIAESDPAKIGLSADADFSKLAAGQEIKIGELFKGQDIESILNQSRGIIPEADTLTSAAETAAEKTAETLPESTEQAAEILAEGSEPLADTTAEQLSEQAAEKALSTVDKISDENVREVLKIQRAGGDYLNKLWEVYINTTGTVPKDIDTWRTFANDFIEKYDIPIESSAEKVSETAAETGVDLESIVDSAEDIGAEQVIDIKSKLSPFQITRLKGLLNKLGGDSVFKGPLQNLLDGKISQQAFDTIANPKNLSGYMSELSERIEQAPKGPVRNALIAEQDYYDRIYKVLYPGRNLLGYFKGAVPAPDIDIHAEGPVIIPDAAEQSAQAGAKAAEKTAEAAAESSATSPEVPVSAESAAEDLEPAPSVDTESEAPSGEATEQINDISQVSQEEQIKYAREFMDKSRESFQTVDEKIPDALKNDEFFNLDQSDQAEQDVLEALKPDQQPMTPDQLREAAGKISNPSLKNQMLDKAERLEKYIIQQSNK